MIAEPEKPIYILKQNKLRAIIPTITTIIFLAIIIYLGILLNLSLLNLPSSSSNLVKIISSLVLLTIIIIGAIITIEKAEKNYLFYPLQLKFRKKVIYFQNLPLPEKKQSVLDKLFKTQTLTLSPEFKIKNIPQELSLQEYIQKLITYAKSS